MFGIKFSNGNAAKSKPFEGKEKELFTKYHKANASGRLAEWRETDLAEFIQSGSKSSRRDVT
jgi:hypothetical protein